MALPYLELLPCCGVPRLLI
ncbi:hypothetical protein LINGRAHAP2_LOCUS10922 [Linum grandiflorum]